MNVTSRRCQGGSSRWLNSKALVCRSEGRAEVATLRGLGGAAAGHLGFSFVLKSASARTVAFIISKVTGFSEKASQAKNEQPPQAAANETPAILLASFLLFFSFFLFFCGGGGILKRDWKWVRQIIIHLQGQEDTQGDAFVLAGTADGN